MVDRKVLGRPGRLLLVLALYCGLMPELAFAHIVKAQVLGFGSGLLHPITGLDHAMAMIAVGIWGAQLRQPAIWILPVVFPLIMAFGGFLALVGVILPGTEIAIAVSVICLGTCVLAEYRAPLWFAGCLVALFGLFHGYSHGMELPQNQDALFFSLGFLLATGCLHAVGIAIGLTDRLAWGRLMMRVIGGLILLGGLYFFRVALS